MTPPASARQVYKSLSAVLALVTMTVAVLAAAAGGAGHQFDEERPPIIVHNGSIVFEPLQRPTDKTRGVWAGSGSIWQHQHPNPGPTVLLVSADPNQNVCKSASSPKPIGTSLKGTKITIQYGNSPSDSQVAVLSVQKDSLLVDFGKNAPVHDTKTQRLIAYSNDSKVRILRATDGPTTCEYTSLVSLTVRQSR
jgi:hypothetical protein